MSFFLHSFLKYKVSLFSKEIFITTTQHYLEIANPNANQTGSNCLCNFSKGWTILIIAHLIEYRKIWLKISNPNIPHNGGKTSAPFYPPKINTMFHVGFRFYPTEQEALEIYLLNKITQNPHLYQGGHDISVRDWNFYGRDDPNDSWKLYGGDQLLEGQAIHFFTKLKKASPKGSRF